MCPTADHETGTLQLHPIKSEAAYAAALHEIGHIRQGPGDDVLLAERRAWDWARENALIWTPTMEREAERGMRAYEEATAGSEGREARLAAYPDAHRIPARHQPATHRRVDARRDREKGTGAQGPRLHFRLAPFVAEQASAWQGVVIIGGTFCGALQFDHLTGSGFAPAVGIIHLISHEVLCGMSIAK